MKPVVSDRVASATSQILETVPNVVERSRLSVDHAVRKTAWIEADDFWTFCVPAKNYIESVITLALLDESFDVVEHNLSLTRIIDRILEKVDGVPTGGKIERLRVLEDVFDAAAGLSIEMEGRDSPKVKELYAAGLQVGPELNKKGVIQDSEKSENACRSLLRLFHLTRFEDVVSTFEKNLDIDPGTFHDDPVVQMAIALYLRAATKCNAGRQVENADFGARIWLDLTIFWWLATKTRIEYSLESYRLSSLMDAFDGDVPRMGSRGRIDFDALTKNLADRAEKFLQ